MDRMITVAKDFQKSVNIAYDLNDDSKLKNFIPTTASLDLLSDILESVITNSNNRARVLVGAYGKGKSHIVLTILSLLMKKDRGLFVKLMPKIDENKKISQMLDTFYESNGKLLPVVISGSYTSITQAFLLALQRTLKENGLENCMPETNFKAALECIKKWKNEYPATYTQLNSELSVPVENLIERLNAYDVSAYSEFEKAYPHLTAGAVFNPFLGFDVVDLYESAVRGIVNYGYSGIYVVYDEFSKYLETNIVETSVSDTKMLQDFAEKCSRSADHQLHLMLICHKEISNYIDKLPKNKVDGWRGVSERFSHSMMSSDYSQTYEVISAVIEKDKGLWNTFGDANKDKFNYLERYYLNSPMFDDVDKTKTPFVLGEMLYPLHPVSAYILPRLSERVAQNERTLFTFLSDDGKATLSAFLENRNEANFELLSPDLIFDYFEPLIRKEVFGTKLHDNYILTMNVLDKLDANTLDAKIVKTISLIYALEQFEKLKPTKEEITNIYTSQNYKIEDVNEAVTRLIEEEYVVYLKRSNGFLRLKESSGIDIKAKIADTIAVQNSSFSLVKVLNERNFDNYMYPSRYNDQREMVRYFGFRFIDASSVKADTNWQIKLEVLQNTDGQNYDGVVYGVIPSSDEELENAKDILINGVATSKQVVFVIPKNYKNFSKVAKEYSAAVYLRDNAANDPILFDEYQVIVDDLSEVLDGYIRDYTRPENYKSLYVWNGINKNITRKVGLTRLLSAICDDVFAKTPAINNEAINKDEITSVASNSRNKIIAGLLRNELEHNLGLIGSGQDVSIMRSTLIRTGVFVDTENSVVLCLTPEDEKMCMLLGTIKDFVVGCNANDQTSFKDLYDRLTLAEYGIGLRKGLIPIYLSVVLHEYKSQVILYGSYGQVPINADTIQQINAAPDMFSISFLDWNKNKEEYINALANAFEDDIKEAEKSNSLYDYVAFAMKRWYIALPKYVRSTKSKPEDLDLKKGYSKVLSALKQEEDSAELLFNLLPKAFGYKDEFGAYVANPIIQTKLYCDNALVGLKGRLADEVRAVFLRGQAKDASTVSVVKEWLEALPDNVFEQLFSDGTDRFLKVCKEAGYSDDVFIEKLARMLTGLRLEDWDDDTRKIFNDKLLAYKNSAEQFRAKESKNISIVANTDVKNTKSSAYELSYIGNDGHKITKRFDKVESTKRGKLLHNAVLAEIEAMGNSISEQEKRQILMEVLKGLC